MKLPFTICDLRSAISKKSPEFDVVARGDRAAGNRKSAIINRKSERGMALVITLILLSVTLVMVLAFLAISNRERSSITTSTDTATARLAADSGLAAAEAQIIANIFADANGNATTNAYNYGLVVSTNYIPPTTGNVLQDLANLQISPRAPVFITTNAGSPLDFRFYLDLNRNGQFDTNGFVVEVDKNNNIIGTNFNAIGDPEWIGVLERPDAFYAPNNPILSRYAYICLPVGNTYDLNYIHNQALHDNSSVVNPPAAGDTYFRNQGVGAWEINLAAFLDDLNINQWTTYSYNETNFGTANSGTTFDDARALVAYRYANNYNSLASAQNLFGVSGASEFQNNIDAYSDGPLMTSPVGINESFQSMNLPWAGADSTNHFFDLSADLFDKTKTQVGVLYGFTDRLNNSGTNTFGGSTVSTYDRYTFSRLLDQLGTDSTPESGKMNLNYDNLDPYIYTIGANTYTNPPSATNFLAWTPLGFFTNAADRMLQLYTANWLAADYTSYTNTFGASVTNAFGVANIPVMVNGQFVYSPAVQRILQLAANIYDATTNTFYPSVFRPFFTQTNGDISIAGYDFILSAPAGASDPMFSVPIEATPTAGLGQDVVTNIYGVPWIIGAKKGFPNFNKVSLETSVQMTRKLEVTRTPTGGVTPTGATAFQFGTNQMYIMSISNFVGVGCWNSYNTPYPKTGIAPVQIVLLDNLAMQLTNNEPGFSGIGFNTTNFNNPNPFIISGWPASSDPNSFLAPLNTNSILLASSVYDYSSPGFISQSLDPANYYDVGVPPLPQFNLQTTNRLRLVMLDSTNIIDYVQLNGMDGSANLNKILADPDDDSVNGGWWSTNTQDGTLTGVPMGVIEQMATSQGTSLYPNNTPPADSGDGIAWDSTAVISVGLPVTHAEEEAYFNAFQFGLTSITYGGKAYNISATNTQAPFTPTRTRVFRYTWQANDPLVHYLTSDLTDKIYDSGVQNVIDWPWNIRQLNDRYMPWGGNRDHPPNPQTPDDPYTKFAYQRAMKDPLVRSSDDWDFPTNKFPTIGWLGRVHRGTPWQTVYLKSSGVDVNDWSTWTGDLNMYDDTNMIPQRDRLLFDVFTTSPNDNATRGQLSVNQTHFPAWSALFSGMIVPTNTSGGYTVIDPGGVNGTNSAVFQLFNNITAMRSAFTNSTSADGAFKHIGDVLSAATLTDQSPFLNWSAAQSDPKGGNLNDELYEWLPQQMMSLLRVSTVPRYVIYSYGQTLAPAGANAVVTGGGAFSGMITNYQPVAETVTRTVLRIEGAPTNTHAVIESFNILPPK